MYIYFKQVNDEGDTVLQQTDEIAHHRGPYHDDWKVLFRCEEPVAFSSSRITVEWDWKDQGWGNQKGAMLLQLVRNGAVLFGVDLASQPAKHEWEHGILEIESGSFIENAQPGDKIQIQRYVGGGGGHELFVRNFSIRLSPEVIFK
jgi:hypothetical protein